MAYLPPEHAVVGKELAVEYMDELYPVTVATVDSAPLLDPDNERVKAAERGSRMRILVCVKRVPLTGGKMVLTADEQALETRHLGFTISPARGVRGRGGGAARRAARRRGRPC